MTPIYETIGTTYSQTRKPDPRITAEIVHLLGLPPCHVDIGNAGSDSSVADIGAGTGNYSRELHALGFRVTAIEPSAVMRAQALPAVPEIRWIDSSAEAIPLPSGAVDGAIIILAYHHFSDPRAAIAEAVRIAGNGPVVLFTMSPVRLRQFWLCDYFPYFLREASAAFPPVQTVAEQFRDWTGREVDVIPFPLPADLTDRFAASGWAQPGIYLDPTVRKGISSFARMPEDELQCGLERLAGDLDSGIWHQKHGDILKNSCYDAGYCFVHIRPG